jgi:hypothetical protein
VVVVVVLVDVEVLVDVLVLVDVVVVVDVDVVVVELDCSNRAGDLPLARAAAAIPLATSRMPTTAASR